MLKFLQCNKDYQLLHLLTSSSSNSAGLWLCRVIELAHDNSHVQFGASHGGNGSNRLDHMADHIYNGQVDDGPVGSKLWLCTGHSGLLQNLYVCSEWFISSSRQRQAKLAAQKKMMKYCTRIKCACFHHWKIHFLLAISQDFELWSETFWDKNPNLWLIDGNKCLFFPVAEA